VTSAFVIAFVLVALAELGDKSQMLLVGFATRYPPLKVLVGTALAIAALQLGAVALGGAMAALVPARLVAVGAGIVFVVYGVVTWRASGGDGCETQVRPAPRFGPVLTVAAAFFVAEFGDKTQLMTLSIAADPGAALRTLGALAPAVEPPAAGTFATSLGVWAGSSLGMLAADAVAIVVGAVLCRHLPSLVIGRFSAVVFVVFGAITLVSAFIG
jgi:putative Ca2+/H+ antiporter (TMEM165/GDT1 family)